LRQAGHAHQDQAANRCEVPRPKPDADATAKGMADEHHRAFELFEDVLLHEIRVLDRAPIVGG
jgi:hypothetical protein